MAFANRKVTLVGSMFPGMIEFDGKQCPAPRLDAAALCLNTDNRLRENKKGTLHLKMEVSLLVPGAGVEPARPQRPQDFKSCVSTNSTIRAQYTKSP